MLRITAKRYCLTDNLLIEIGMVCTLGLFLVYWCVTQARFVSLIAIPVGLFALGWCVPIVRGRSHGYSFLPVGQFGPGVKLLGGAAFLASVLLVLALNAVRFWQLNVPLMVPPASTQWGQWMVFQFTHVALPEEVFFRGYVLTGLVQWNRQSLRSTGSWNVSISVVLSSAVFALFHVIVQQSGFGLLTFFPGLILGVLFVKTQSLVIPVMFHVLANVGYALVVSVMF